MLRIKKKGNINHEIVKNNDVTTVKKTNLKDILDQEKALYSKRPVKMVFPFMFSYSMPLISYKTIDLYDFISIEFVQTDYVFALDVAVAVVPYILNLEFD